MSLNKLLIVSAVLVSFSGVALADDAMAPAASGAAPAKHAKKHHHKKKDAMAAPAPAAAS